MTQLGGDAVRNVSPLLDAPWGSLISPDKIVDHFSDLFDIQADFLPLAQSLLPFYRRRMTESVI